jgi:hypothetical protein
MRDVRIPNESTYEAVIDRFDVSTIVGESSRRSARLNFLSWMKSAGKNTVRPTTLDPHENFDPVGNRVARKDIDGIARHQTIRVHPGVLGRNRETRVSVIVPPAVRN